MKRVLFTFLLLLPLAANAQLKVLSVKEAKVEVCHITESSNRGMDARIYVYFGDGVYYLQAHTSNRFDDLFIFYLGDTQEGAVETLNDLAGLCDGNPVGTRITLERWPGVPCACIIASSFSTTSKAPNGTDLKPARLLLSSEGYAGIVNVSKKNILLLADKLKKYKP